MSKDVKFIFVKESYDQGAEQAIRFYLGKLAEEMEQSVTQDDTIFEATSGFGEKDQEVRKPKENLKDIFMKRDDLSHGPTSTTSGQGTSNNG